MFLLEIALWIVWVCFCCLETDFEELGNWKLNWERNYAMESKKKEDQQAKLKESKLKKQEKIIVRNDH